jgi:hypothetical protein
VFRTGACGRKKPAVEKTFPQLIIPLNKSEFLWGKKIWFVSDGFPNITLQQNLKKKNERIPANNLLP